MQRTTALSWTRIRADLSVRLADYEANGTQWIRSRGPSWASSTAGGTGFAARRLKSMSWVEQGKFASWVEQGADLARDGVVRFRRADLRDRIAAEFGVTLHERSVGKLLRRLDFRHLTVRPQHPQSDRAAQEAFKKTSKI